MDVTDRTKVRGYVGELLRAKDDTAGFTDSDSLIISGRLDSLAAVEIVVFLEREFGIDFAVTDFDQTRIDSIDEIARLISQSRG